LIDIMKIVNLIGKRFGKLVVIVKSKRTDKRHNQYWVCKCDCGNYKEIRGHHLGKSISSCGCLQKLFRKLPKGESSFNQLFFTYKQNAKKAGRSFGLTKTEFKKLTQQNCTYCGEPPSQIVNKPKHNGIFIYNGIDRLDNSKGYTKNNSVPCCKVCNLMKRTLSCKEFISKVKQIYKHSVVD